MMLSFFHFQLALNTFDFSSWDKVKEMPMPQILQILAHFLWKSYKTQKICGIFLFEKRNQEKPFTLIEILRKDNKKTFGIFLTVSIANFSIFNHILSKRAWKKIYGWDWHLCHHLTTVCNSGKFCKKHRVLALIEHCFYNDYNVCLPSPFMVKLLSDNFTLNRKNS